LDSDRAKQIVNSAANIEVLYHGSPVWIENVKDTNTAEVTYLETHETAEVPVYKLVEVNPANKQ
jgi:small acid-soluble spore protein H (minor)